VDRPFKRHSAVMRRRKVRRSAPRRAQAPW
jgi:hypothetical protein